MVFLAHFTHTSFEALLDMDVLTFNSLLDASVQVDASRWEQTAYLHRAAQHAEQKSFEKMVKKSWGGAAKSDTKPKKGVADLFRDLKGGF